jgi:hypothetical protein
MKRNRFIGTIMKITAITGSQRQNGNTSSAVQVLFSHLTTGSY